MKEGSLHRSNSYHRCFRFPGSVAGVFMVFPALVILVIAAFPPASVWAQVFTGDFVTVTDDTARVYVILRYDNDTFGALTYIEDLGSNCRSTAIGDFDDDGNLDFIAGYADGTYIYPCFYKGNGDGTFQPRVALTRTSGSGSWMMDAVVGDFDKDGRLDFIVNGNSGSVGFYWGNGDGTFVQETRSLPAYGRGMDAGDFNGDDIEDFVRATHSNGYIRLYLSNGDRTFTEASSIVGDAGDDPYGVAAGDFDSDGRLDVLANAGSSGNVTFFKGNGDGTFQAGVLRPELDVNNHGAMDAFDFNVDGRLDVVLTAYSSRAVYFWPGNGDSTFGTRVTLSGSPSTNSLGLSAPPLPPLVDVGISPQNPVVSLGDALTLSAVGAGVAPGDGFEWQFGDGTTGAGQEVTHTYTSEGVFVAGAIHTNAAGIRSWRYTHVTVEGSTPVADPGGPYSLNESAAHHETWTATLNGSGSTDDFGIVQYEWDFGDGATGSGAAVTHTWDGTGPWTVTLTVTDSSGQQASASTTVAFTPGAPPAAVITGPAVVDETSASSGIWSVPFSAAGSSDDFGIWQYNWSFGNGVTGSGAIITAPYSAVGVYTVTLTVMDHAGQTDTATHEVEIVANALPVAVIGGPVTLDESVATAGRWASSWDASGSSDDTGIYRYRWNFGDGSAPVTGSAVNHEFAGTGAYTVTLEVTDNGNQVVTTTQVVSVVGNDPPVARIDASATIVEGSQPFFLTGAPSTDDYGIHSYRWSLPARLFDFAGYAIDTTQWRVGAGVSQNNRLIVNGASGWGNTYFFNTGVRVRRGVVFEGRVDTPTGTSTAMIGLKNLNFSSGHYNQLVYAVYFNSGNLYIYEKGNSRGLHGSYSRGTSYDVRIETKPGAGARYYIRPSGTGAGYSLLYDSNNYTDGEFSFGADVNAGVFGFDNLSVDSVFADGRDITASVSLPGGDVTLEVTDNALQTDTETLHINSITGAPPEAAIDAPAYLDLGIEGVFSGTFSTDDYGIASYHWDFGDGTAANGETAYHFYSSIGTYAVTLTVYDYAGQSDTAAKSVEVSGENLVVCVPWQIVGGVEVPHDTWSGEEAVLKAAAKSASVPISYTWDFGDGSSESGTITNAADRFAIEARHIYVGSVGEPFTATITITDAAGITASDIYRLIIRNRTLEIEENVAIDSGLWWLYKNQIRGTWAAGTYGDAPVEYSYWSSYSSYHASPTASAVQAFLINGHIETGDPVEDPYVETVRRGMRYIFTRLSHTNIGPQTYGDPDTNGNGIGLGVDSSRAIYEGGMVMDAIAATGTPDAVARTGGTNVRGRTYGDILTDMVDMFAWGQYDHASVGGGWRYSWNEPPDNSAAQWGAIGLLAAEEVFGIIIPQWVKDRNNVWLSYSYNGTGFGYTGPGCTVARTPSGMVQLAFCDRTTSDSRWRTAENWIANTWTSWRNSNDVYAYYAFTKAMRQAQPAEVVTLGATGLDWFGNETSGLARYIINRQQADLGWPTYEYGRTFATAWQVIILTRTLFVKPPVAIVHASPNPGAVGQEIRVDATASYHLDPFRSIVAYQWDFDSSDGLDWDHPDATGAIATHTYGALRDYTVTLRVVDNNVPVRWDTDVVLIRITIPPHPPTAEADGPYIAAVGEPVTLDASGSYDIDEADGDSITAYGWEIDMVSPRDFDDAAGVSPTIPGFGTAGAHPIGLRVTDNTSVAFPGSGSPNLTDDDFTEVIVYSQCITDLSVRPKMTKAQLVWTDIGADEYRVYRSSRGPNVGYELIGTTDSAYSTFMDYNVVMYQDYWYRVMTGDEDNICSSYAFHIRSVGRIVNRPPVITSTPPVTAQEGVLYSYDVEAADPNGDAITYILDQAPAGMTIDEGTGIIQWTPVYAQVGPNNVTVRAQDSLGASATQFFTIDVAPRPNLAPVADPGGPYYALRGDSIAFDGSGSYDPEDDLPLTYNWNFGDGSTSDVQNPTHIYTAAGLYTVALFVTDSRGATGSAETTAQIEEPNRVPTAEVADGPGFEIRLGEALTLDGSPSYDPDGDPLTYSWSWGDSTPSDTGVTASHTYARVDTYLGSLTVYDGRGGQDIYEFTVGVNPPNNLPVASFVITVPGVNIGDEFTFDATASYDPDSDPISGYEWAFGDGSTTTGIVVTHVFNIPGDFTVTLTVRDNHAGEGTASEDVHINAPPVFSSVPPTTTNEDELFSYAPVVTDADGDPMTFVLLSAPAGMGFDPNTAALSWIPGNDDVGDHAVAIRASDGNNAMAEHSFVLTVVDVNDPPVITSSPLLTATEDQLYTYQVAAYDVDDASLTFQLDESPSGMTIGSSSGLVEWTPATDDLGDHTVTVSVHDGRGGSDSQTFTLTAQEVNDAPVITSTPVVDASEEVAYTYDVDATDEESDPLTYSLTQSPAGMTIDSSTGLIQWTPDVGGTVVMVGIEVSDGRGGADSQIFGVTVANVNDPPVITSSPVIQALAARLYQYDVNATDEEGDVLTYSLTTAPAGMTINSATGLIQWSPVDADVGTHPVELQVGDGNGGSDSQSYNLQVLEQNREPEITSLPITEVYEDTPYEYDVEAADPDANPLTFALDTAPAGMTIDPTSGLIQWTPAAADVGGHTVTASVDDGLGGIDTQTYTLSVVAVNDPPEITSTPGTEGEPGFMYTYEVEATDEEGDPLSFTLDTAPAGMAIDGTTGLMEWTPTIGQVGDHLVVVRVTDLPGDYATQSFVIAVEDRQHPPVVSSISGQVVQDPNPFLTISLDDFVADPDHADSEMIWTTSGDAELTVDIDADRVAAITYAPGTRVTELITFTATDPDGLSDSVTASFTVAEPSDDVIPPVAVVTVTPEEVPLGGSATIDIQAQDNEGIGSVTVTVDGSPIPVIDLGGGNFRATFSGTVLGLHTIDVVVLDLAGNDFSDSVEVLVVDPSVTSQPTADIISPAANAIIKLPTNVIGTASGNDFVDYRLELAPIGTSDFMRIAHGTSPVTGGVLGSIDTTLFANGIYTLRLTARNLGGNEASDSISIVIDSGENKPGNFSITFTDLRVPVSGIPITVKRTYDSRTRGSSMDFGYGWKVEVVKAGTYTNNCKPGEGWVFTSGWFLPCQNASPTRTHITEIRFSDTEFYRFSLHVDASSGGMGFCEGVASFTQIGGVPGATLDILGDNGVLYVYDGNVYDWDLNVFEPEDVRLTTIDGRVFDLNLVNGLERIGDANGNSIFINSGGVVHSSGKSISFTRDGRGRITAITDPMGNSIAYDYDIAGNLMSATDREGNTTTFAYDADHFLTDIMDPLGNVPLRNEYDDSGRLVAQIDADGNRTEIDVDVAANTTAVTNRLGVVSQFQYNNAGLVTQATSNGRTIQSTYDSRGNKLTATDPLGNVRSFTYDAGDNLTSETDPLGNTISYAYNASGRPASFTDPNGNVTSFTYDANGNLTEMRDADGDVIQAFTYGANGKPVQITALGGTANLTYDAFGNLTHQQGPGALDRTFAYDNNGNVLSRTDALGGVTSYTYDKNGKVTSITDPLGNTTTFTYNGIRRVATETDARGNTTSYEYDPRGSLVRKNYPDGTFEAYGYDLENRKTAEMDRAGRTTFYDYDAESYITQITFPDGSFVQNAYDPRGKLTSYTDERGNSTTFEYDPSGRLIRTSCPLGCGGGTLFTYNANGARTSVTDPLGNVTQYEYDESLFGLPRLARTIFADGATAERTYASCNRVATQTDELGNVTAFAYDAAGNLITVTDALGNVTTYEYDASGNMIRQTDANGNATTFEYDANGNMTRRTLPMGMSETFVYDPVGNMAAHTDFNGDTTTFEYDAMNRLIGKELPDSTTVVYTYTPAGQIATITDSRGETSFTYDLRDRLIQLENPDGTVVSYDYDAAGNRTSVTTDAGVTSYSYDELNRLIQVVDPQSGLTTCDYDAAGNRASAVYPNGLETYNTYDTRNRLTSIVHTGPGGSPAIAGYEYTLGPTGNRTQLTESSGRIVNYTYDALSRLTVEMDNISGIPVITNYTYDGVGNRLSMNRDGVLTNYLYDANNRMASAGSESFGYDNNGNMIQRDAGGGLVTDYTYDAANRLIGQAAPGGTTTFAYDDFGNRVQRNAAGVVTEFTVDPKDNSGLPQVLVERDGVGAITASYVYGDDLIQMQQGAAGYYYHTDGIGSTRLLSDGSGAVSDTYDYDAYGNMIAFSGTTVNPYLFTGEQFDPDMALYYLRARYMDPQFGRFTSMDPFAGSVLDPMSLHKYMYARNNPVNMIDPTGRQFTLGSCMVAASIVSILASIAIPTYIVYKDVSDILDKWNELTQKIPTMKLNEEATRADLRNFAQFNLEEIDKMLGEGIVAKAYSISADLVGDTGGKAVAFIWSFSTRLWMAELPMVDNKPGHYLGCGFNEYVASTYAMHLVNGIATKPFKAAFQILGCWLNYYNFLALVIDTVDEIGSGSVPAQPPNNRCW